MADDRARGFGPSCMIAFALRRFRWSIPTLLGLFVIAVFLASFAPGRPIAEPTAPPFTSALLRGRLEQTDLPRFFNANPEDVVSRSEVAMRAVAEGGPDSDLGQAYLVRVGGAALPYVLPKMDTLRPESRRRVARALSPVAERMELIPDGSPARDPDAEVRLWSDFYAIRGADFSPVSARRAVARYARAASEARERELRMLDAYALPELVRAVGESSDPAVIERLTAAIHRLAPAHRIVSASLSPAERTHALSGWADFWQVYRSDYEAFDGTARVVAMVTNTRYIQGILRMARRIEVQSASQGGFLPRVLERSSVTILLAVSAVILAGVLALPLGHALFVLRRQSLVVDDLGSVALSCPAPALAFVFLLWLGAGSMLGAVFALTLPLVWSLTRHQAQELARGPWRALATAVRARGASPLRAAVRVALGATVRPMVLEATQRTPATVGSVILVEGAFSVRGLGFELCAAARTGDAGSALALIVTLAVVVLVALALGDLLYGLLDPSTRRLRSPGERMA